MLKFSVANAKLQKLRNVERLAKYLQKRKVYSADLPSGYTCPYAVDCLSKAKVIDGKAKVVDGPDTKFRCFSASQEGLFTNVRNARWHNFNHLRGLSSGQMIDKICASIPFNLGICRIHVGGDFFNLQYMLAWASVAELYPSKLFYAYTKSIPFWLKHRGYFDSLPNFVLTASYGGRRDDLIASNNLPSAKVVFSVDEAERLGLPIDSDDSHAADPMVSDFALLIHGVQPKGSDAALALKELKGKGSYSR